MVFSSNFKYQRHGTWNEISWCVVILGKAKVEMIYLLEQRISSKLESWDAKMLSQAGRTCLLKSVTNMMANYGMSCLSVPNKVVKDISSKRSKFRWGKNIPKFCHFIGWDKICKPKSEHCFLVKACLENCFQSQYLTVAKFYCKI